MLGRIYSKKDLMNNHKYYNKNSQSFQQINNQREESHEDKMKRYLRNNKNRSSKRDLSQKNDEKEEKYNFSKKEKEKKYSKNESSNNKQSYQGRESDIDLMNMDVKDLVNKKKITYSKRKSSSYDKEENNSESKSYEYEDEDTQEQNKTDYYIKKDPFKELGYQTEEEEKMKLKEDIIKEMLYLEKEFTKEYSKHIDTMVNLVRKDISLQTKIKDEKGPLKFSECLDKVNSIVKMKQDSLASVTKSLEFYQQKYYKLKKKKENAKTEYSKIKPIQTSNSFQPQQFSMTPRNISNMEIPKRKKMRGSYTGDMIMSQSSKGLTPISKMNMLQVPNNDRDFRKIHNNFLNQNSSGRKSMINMNAQKNLNPNLLMNKVKFNENESSSNSKHYKDHNPSQHDYSNRQKFSMLPSFKFGISKLDNFSFSDKFFRVR